MAGRWFECDMQIIVGFFKNCSIRNSLDSLTHSLANFTKAFNLRLKALNHKGNCSEWLRKVGQKQWTDFVTFSDSYVRGSWPPEIEGFHLPPENSEELTSPIFIRFSDTSSPALDFSHKFAPSVPYPCIPYRVPTGMLTHVSVMPCRAI